MKDTPAARFTEIFWGLLLANVMVAIDGHRVSQGLGYILLAVGAAGLATRLPRFRQAAALSWAALCWMLLSAWLFDLLQVGDPMTGSHPVVYSAVGDVLACLLVWTLFGAISHYAASRHRGEFVQWASIVRVACLVLVVGRLVLGAVPVGQGHVPLGLKLGYTVAWVAWLVVALRLVYRVRAELAVNDESPVPQVAGPFWPTRLVLAAVLALLGVLACYPALLTGSFGNVRIDKLSVGDDGQVSIAYTIRATSGTEHRDVHQPRTVGGSGCSSGFPAWPQCGTCQGSFFLGSSRKPFTAQEVRERLRVTEGQTYRLTPEKPLWVYDFEDQDGARRFYRIEIGERRL